MNKLLFIIGIAVAVVYFGGTENSLVPTRQEVDSGSIGTDQVLFAAFEQHQSRYQVQGAGEVVRILSDDYDGSRHQRFILRLASGQTLLFAHNIDLAQRIDSLQAGDHVEFNGEYEWNAEGGVIHWTHRDPQGRHESGWLKHNNVTYQ